MTLKHYLKEKVPITASIIILIGLFFLLGYALKINHIYIACISFLTVVVFIINIVNDFIKRKKFYDDFVSKLEGLDQKYLITEMIERPNFFEGTILCESLYDIDKSMKEAINVLERDKKEFKEFIEMWIHEIKVPIASISLVNYNSNQIIEDSMLSDEDRLKFENELLKQKQHLKKLSHYVEQILYFARADAPYNDYLMKKCNLESIVNKVILDNKDLLIGERIKVEKSNLDITILTDSKWFEFMLGQVINNAIKYIRKDSRRIVLEGIDSEEKVLFSVTDYGIGISENDLERVFEKSFTGENGRIETVSLKENGSRISTSTGMGLYICKLLCDKLGHIIRIESKKNEYTKVFFEIGKDNYYKVV